VHARGTSTPVPTIGGALRAAAGDFFFNSWRLVPANVLWAAGLVATLIALATLPPLGLLLAVLLTVPAAGVFRLAAIVARGEPASFSDALEVWTDQPMRLLGLGLAIVAAGLVLVTNVLTGTASGSPIGWAIATFAGWGLLAGWCWLLCLWPILLDPTRSRGIVVSSRLAALVVLAQPFRLALLGAVLALALVVSAVAFLLLFTVTLSYVALAAARYVLPATDRMEIFLAERESRHTAR
jgi:hypothetical protein